MKLSDLTKLKLVKYSYESCVSIRERKSEESVKDLNIKRKDFLVNSERNKLEVQRLEEKYRSQRPQNTASPHKENPNISVR